MSHELRTPLSAIIGYSELLEEELDETGTQAQLPDLRKVQGAAKHSLSLVNDVLDFSKIEAGKMEVAPEWFEVAPLVREVVATCNPMAANNANRIRIDGDVQCDTIYADPRRVQQIMLNLLGNACKFTRDGEVTVRTYPQRYDGQDCLVLEVQDTGIGMSEEQIAKLFQEFSQADFSPTRRFEGTGLGLAISQRFCTMMGGAIAVQSEPGVGSIFAVRLPKVAAPVVGGDSSTLAPSPADAPTAPGAPGQGDRPPGVPNAA